MGRRRATKSKPPGPAGPQRPPQSPPRLMTTLICRGFWTVLTRLNPISQILTVSCPDTPHAWLMEESGCWGVARVLRWGKNLGTAPQKAGPNAQMMYECPVISLMSECWCMNLLWFLNVLCALKHFTTCQRGFNAQSLQRKLHFGILMLSLEVLLLRTPLAGLRDVNLEADFVAGAALWRCWSADVVAGDLEVQISWLGQCFVYKPWSADFAAAAVSVSAPFGGRRRCLASGLPKSATATFWY